MKRSSYPLEYKWTVSRGRDTYGYNICTLRVDGTKVASCNGGGYDMEGTVLGEWVTKEFKDELLKLKEKFYGLSFHDPDYAPEEAVIDGETVEEREKKGLSVGLERYQSFYSASSDVPTERHIVPLIDGACGKESVRKIIQAIGYDIEFIHSTKNLTIERVYKRELKEM